MKVEVKKIDATRRQLKFVVPKERIQTKTNQMFDEMMKHANIKGFRPGKAPRHVVEAQHGGLARQEAIKDLIPEIYQEGLNQEKINPMDLPEITDVSFDNGDLTFIAHIDIRPEIKIKNYKKIPVSRPSSVVTDEEFEKTLEFFKKGKGDETVTLDDAFAHGLGYSSLDDFKSSLRRQLEMDKDRQSRVEVENQIVEYLLKESDFHLPQSTVNKQLEHRLEEHKKRLKSQRIPDEEVRKREDQLRKDLRPIAEKDIKMYLLMAYIAKEENIEIHEKQDLFHKVLEFLLKEAKWEESKSS